MQGIEAGMRSTKRMRAASAALLDAATEVASTIDPTTLIQAGSQLSGDAVSALCSLYAANDEWQEAQLAAPEYRKPKLRKRRDPVFADVDAKRDLESTMPRPLFTAVLARREKKVAR